MVNIVMAILLDEFAAAAAAAKRAKELAARPVRRGPLDAILIQAPERPG